MLEILTAIYAAVNLIVFIMYGADKSKAKHHKWRIPESTLIGFAFLGIIGALLGMLVFRHKTRKPAFAVGLPLIFIAETAVLLFVILRPN